MPNKIQDPARTKVRLNEYLINTMAPHLRERYEKTLNQPGVSGPGYEDYQAAADQQALHSLMSGIQSGASRVGGIETRPSALGQTLSGLEQATATQLKAGEQAAADSAASRQAAQEGMFKLGEFESQQEEIGRKREREDYTFDLTKQENDPNSDLSRNAIAGIKRVLPSANLEGFTYAQLKTVPNQLVQSQLQRVRDQETQKFQAGQQRERLSAQERIAQIREQGAAERSKLAMQQKLDDKSQKLAEKEMALTTPLGLARDTDSAKKLRASIIARDKIVNNARKLRDLVEQHGTRHIPGINADIQGQMGALETAIIGDLTVLNESGVLNTGEFDRYKKQIGTGWTSTNPTGSTEYVKASLDQLLEGVEKGMESKKDAWLRPGAKPEVAQSKPAAQFGESNLNLSPIEDIEAELFGG